MRRLFDAIEEEVVVRRGLPDRMVLVLADAALGYRIRNATYRSATDVSNNLASRDLKILVDHGFLVPSGQRRGRTYSASNTLRDLRTKHSEKRVVEDPYNPSEPVDPKQERLF